MDGTVRDRVRKVMEAASVSQAAFAERVGLTADKLSKSLKGVRRFTSLDLARIAESGGTTVDWLLGGREPLRPSFAARTDGTAEADAGAAASLEGLLRRFGGAYEVLEDLGRPRSLPALPGPREDLERFVDQGEELAREALARLAAGGAGPVAELDTSELVDALDRLFGVDVAQVRLPDGVDGVAWHTDRFRLVLLARTDRWTRQRFTLAHELGHLLARDAQEPLPERHLAPGRQKDHGEVRANVFAAGFLMPERELRLAVDEARGGADGLTEAALAGLVVRFQVSPSALAARLHRLGAISGGTRRALRGMTTEQCHLLAGEARRLQDRTACAVAERVPSGPARSLYDAYEAAETTLRPLAAYLDRDVDVLREQLVPDPPVTALPADEKGDLVFQP